MTPDNIKYGHTPTGPEVIAGVTLKDAKRASKWPAYVDVAQSVTGAILGIFLFCHMAFTSSIQVGKDLFWNLIQVSGGTPIFGHEQIWLALFVRRHHHALRHHPRSVRSASLPDFLQAVP